MKHASLESPVKGKEYWVIRYPMEIDPDYSIEPEDFCVAEYLGDNIWKTVHFVKFCSSHYMEVPTL